MAGSSLNDLRKLSSDIERKKKTNDENKRQAGLAHREALSNRMQEEKKERDAKMGKMASNTEKIKTLLITCFVGGIAIAGVLILRSGLSEKDTKKTVFLMDSELKQLDATNRDFNNVSSFTKDLIAKFDSEGDPESIKWSSGATSSLKERSMKKLQNLSSGTWKMDTVYYNEKHGFFIVKCSNTSGGIVTLILTEDAGYKLFLARAY